VCEYVPDLYTVISLRAYYMSLFVSNLHILRIIENERVERGSRQVASIVQDISTSCMGDIR